VPEAREGQMVAADRRLIGHCAVEEGNACLCWPPSRRLPRSFAIRQSVWHGGHCDPPQFILRPPATGRRFLDVSGTLHVQQSKGRQGAACRPAGCRMQHAVATIWSIQAAQ
jgi:hypothetical protein